jgi:hypothetical protein
MTLYRLNLRQADIAEFRRPKSQVATAKQSARFIDVDLALTNLLDVCPSCPETDKGQNQMEIILRASSRHKAGDVTIKTRTSSA